MVEVVLDRYLQGKNENLTVDALRMRKSEVESLERSLSVVERNMVGIQEATEKYRGTINESQVIKQPKPSFISKMIPKKVKETVSEGAEVVSEGAEVVSKKATEWAPSLFKSANDGQQPAQCAVKGNKVERSALESALAAGVGFGRQII